MERDKRIIKLLKETETILERAVNSGNNLEMPEARRALNRVSDVLTLLKKNRKDNKPKVGHWIFEDQFCEAWSHICSECGKRMTTGVNVYANWCWNCGAKNERQ